MNDTSELPFVAPAKRLPLSAPFRWLQRGFRDFRRALPQSLFFGAIAVASSYAISLLAWIYGNLGLFLGLLSGFVFLGPLLALTLYSISDQLDHDQTPSVATCFRDAWRAAGNALVFAMVLTVIFLVWARAASMLHIFFPAEGDYALRDLALFLGVGSAVGALFAAIVFTASAFSLPMLIDRRTDAITAVITSANAVLRNKPAMAVWALLIVAITLLGFATLYFGFLLLMPVAGYASWHGYCETIDASQWPSQPR